MRSKLFVLSVGLAVGCGGGSDKPKLPDAKVFMDAGIDAAPLCTIDAMLGGLQLENTNPNSCGANGTSNCDYFIIPGAMAANAGMKTLLVGGGLPSSNAAGRDILAFEVVRPAAGYQMGTPYMFETTLANTYVAAAYVLGDFANNNYAQLYWASNGSVSFNANIAQTSNVAIAGMVAATSLREMNEMTGQPVAGGCTAQLDGLAFNLAQGQDVDTNFAPEDGSNGAELEPLTDVEKAMVLKAITNLKNAQQLQQQ